jgi:hypothetical protein
MVVSFSACRRRPRLVRVYLVLLLIPALVFVPGCSDDSVSTGTGPSSVRWTIENPTFTAWDLHAVWAASPSDVWAGGDRGELIHFDGSVWERVESEADWSIYDIFGTSPQSIFAVGDGAILEYDGTEWESIGFNEWSYFRAVWASSEHDVFVAENSSKIFHYDGSAWSEMELPAIMRLLDLWGASPDDVYAVGDSPGGMIHYDGSAWSIVDLSTAAANVNLTSISGSSSHDIYAVGYGKVLHFDGTEWSAVEDIPKQPESDWHYDARLFTGVRVNETGEAYLVSEYGDVVHFDGASWRWIRVPTSPCSRFWSSIIAGSGTDVYIANDDPAVLHYDGSEWEEMMGPVEDLEDVWGSSDRDVYAVGSYGTVLHFDGIQWSQTTIGTCSSLRGVWGVSSNDVFAVGSNVVIHFDGTSWSRLYQPNDDLNDVWGTSHDDVFCVGRYGIHHFDGAGWKVWWTGGNLMTVWGAAPNDVYAAGDRSLYHFDGADWTLLPGDETFRVFALEGAGGFGRGVYGAGQWRTGYNPCVARLEVDGWRPVHKPSCEDCGSADLHGLWIGGNGTIAAVGGAPPLVTFFNGSGWEDVNLWDGLPELKRYYSLNGVWSEDGIRFVAVGNKGLIVRGER